MENKKKNVRPPAIETLESRVLLTANYQIVDLGVLPGGTASAAYGINQYGAVVGNADVPGGYTHAVKYSNKMIANLGTLAGGKVSHGYSINSQGNVVGEALVGQYDHAFLYANGVMRDLGTLGGNSSFAYGINDSQTVVGGSFIAGNKVVHAFIWTPANGMRDLGTLGGGFSLSYGITNAGKVVGYSTNSRGQNHAFLYDGTMHDLGLPVGSSRTIAYGLNTIGQIVGSAKIANNENAFLYQRGKFTNLGTLGGISSSSYAINSSGVVVGLSTVRGSTTTHAFVDSGGKMYDLNAEISANSGWTLVAASAINDSGEIVGVGFIHGHMHGFLLMRSFAMNSITR